MFKGILAALFAVLASPCFAQDIAIPMHLIGNGSLITIQTNTGQTYTHRMLGQSGPNEYVYETYSGHSPAGVPAWVQYSDGRGNLTSRVDAQGRITTWTPHRCNRTLGPCTYTETRADGGQVHFTRITNPIVGGFTYNLYNDAGVVTVSGRAILNELGWTQWGSSQRLNEAPTTVEILSAHYR